MSYSIHGYAVHWPCVQAWLEENRSASDVDLFRGIERDLDRLDKRFETEIRGGAPTAREALRALARGTSLGRSHGFMYAYLMRLLIECEGATLPNDALSGVRTSEFFGRADAILASRGLKRTLFEDMVVGQLPIALPPADGFPGLGFLDVSEMAIVRSELESLDLQGVDSAVVAAVRQGHRLGWGRRILRQLDRDILLLRRCASWRCFNFCSDVLDHAAPDSHLLWSESDHSACWTSLAY